MLTRPILTRLGLRHKPMPEPLREVLTANARPVRRIGFCVDCDSRGPIDRHGRHTCGSSSTLTKLPALPDARGKRRAS